MKSLLTLPLLFAFLAAFQSGPTAGVNAKTYPPTKFDVTKEQHTLGDLTIKVVQIKKKTPDGTAPRFCRAWVEGWKGDNLFKRADYGDIDPRGESYGIFVPREQPSNKYLMAIKEGDGDPRVLLFSLNGDFLEMAGGSYLVSADKRYLITQTTSQGGGISVFDFSRDEVLLDNEEVPPIYSWRAGGQGGGYFFTEAQPADDGGRPTEIPDFAYAVYFHPPAVKKVKMVGADSKSPKVKLDFDPRKLPNCTSAPQ